MRHSYRPMFPAVDEYHFCVMKSISRPVYRGNYGGGDLPDFPWWPPCDGCELAVRSAGTPEEEKEESIENIEDEETWEAWKSTMHLVGDTLEEMSFQLAMFMYCKLN